jgi:hypothetical protein
VVSRRDAEASGSRAADGAGRRVTPFRRAAGPDGTDEDRELARELFGCGRAMRLQRIDTEEKYWRLSLARMLVEEAEAVLERASNEAEEAAEVAAAVAAMLDSSPGGEERRTAVLACWLLGKARLKTVRRLEGAADGPDGKGAGWPPGVVGAAAAAAAGVAARVVTRAVARAAFGAESAAPETVGGEAELPERAAAAAAGSATSGRRLRGRFDTAVERPGRRERGAWGRLLDAAEAFSRISAFVSTDAPSWDRALAAMGLAQVQWRQGCDFEGNALFTVAAQGFSRVGAMEPMVACQVQHGFLLLGAGERMQARLELTKAARRLDATRAPTLAVLTAMGLACCEAAAGRAEEAAAQVGRAQAIWRGWQGRAAAVTSGAMPAEWRTVVDGVARDEAVDEAMGEGLPEEAGAGDEGAGEERAGKDETVVADGSVAAEGAEGLVDRGDGASTAGLGDRAWLVLLAGSPWRGDYAAELVTLADRMLLGRAEDDPAVGGAR